MSNNQADFLKVDINVMKIMERHWGAEFDKETMNDFSRILGKYSDAVLKKAMMQLIEEHKRKPTIAHIVDACKAQLVTKTSIMSGDEDFPWIVRDRKRHQIVDEYVKNFLLSSTYSEAQREKWSIPLLAYVREIAWIQAQIIEAGTNGIGWNGMVIFDAQEITDEMRRQFFADMYRQGNQGFINVAIPTSLIQRWKERAKLMATFAEAQEKVSARRQTTPGLDEYLNQHIQSRDVGFKQIAQEIPEVEF